MSKTKTSLRIYWGRCDSSGYIDPNTPYTSPGVSINQYSQGAYEVLIDDIVDSFEQVVAIVTPAGADCIVTSGFDYSNAPSTLNPIQVLVGTKTMTTGGPANRGFCIVVFVNG